MACHQVKEGLTQAYTFLSEHPSLLASLVAYTLAPKATLRAWMAVSALPPAEGLNEEGEKKIKKLTKKMRFVAFFTVAALLSGEYYLITRGSESVLNAFMVGMVSLMVFFATLATLADVSSAVRFAVYRAPNGRPVWMKAPGSVVRWKMAVSLVGSAGITYASFFHPSTIVSLVVATTIAHRFIARPYLQTISLRGVMMVLLGWIFISLVLSGVIIAYLISFPETISRDGEAGQEPSGPRISPEVDSYFQHIAPSLWAAGPGFLIATCLRFDYSQHIARTAATESSLPVELVDPPTKKCFRTLLTTQGVLVPNRAPTSFKKPYFHTALFGWIVSQFIVGAAFALLPVPQEILETNAFELSTLLLCIPFLVISILIAAKARGEFRDMWRYKEEWGTKKADSPSDDGEAAEVAPAYQDVVKAEVAEEEVPPYQLVDVKA